MERWYWIELIGFDNEAEDFGVDAFLSRNVSTTGVSLLFAHIDFLFEQQNERLAPTACSYGGHEYSRERRRGEWTKTQLKGLVKTLHDRGIKVFFSCFDMTERITDPDWLCFDENGEPCRLLYVLKNAGGTNVGDAVIERLCAVLDEYGFDGLQLADGLSSNRRSIENGDFSLQLCEDFGVTIPKRLMREGKEAYAARRAWILKHARFEWIEYLAKGWESFYERLFAAVKKPIMFNIAWTRDSFEALYRYGLDYSRCQLDKAFAIMIEENSATRGITAPEDEGRVRFSLAHRDTFTYEYALMQQDIKLMTDGKNQIALMPISDTQEQWDALRHCPTELIRAIVKRYNNFVYRNGQFEVCSNAPLYCLSDGIPAEDWRWMAKQESYRLPSPTFIDGFAAVSNPEALYADVRQFCENKRYFGSALLGELVNNGLNMSAQLALCDVSAFDKAKCLVVTNLNAYTEEDKKLLEKAKLPILVIGEDVELPMKKCAHYAGKYVSVALYGDAPDINTESLASLERSVPAGKLQRGEIWTEPLQYKRVRSEFFVELCRILNTAFDLDLAPNTDVKINSFLCGNDKYLLLSNDLHTYCLPTVNTNTRIADAQAIMKDKGYKVKFSEKSFCVRIPPRCIEIVKITPEHSV